MFRRKWSGLPKDQVFPDDLKSLGYFVNDIDEIRSIENPKYYFKFFITKNERVNDRQRFHFNRAVERIIASRLESEQLQRVCLPLGSAQRPSSLGVPAEPHVPIYVSAGLLYATRIVLIFGESTQDLGVLAHRVIGGPGGINAGSMVGVVQALKAQKGSLVDSNPPGVVLANTGQLWWWPEGRGALCRPQFSAAPMQSAVHWGKYYHSELNSIPGNRTPAEHIRCVLQQVVGGKMASQEARLDIIGIGDAADELAAFFNDEETWKLWGSRLNTLSLLGGFFNSSNLTCAGFKQFMRERARAWCIHSQPLGTLISTADGNPKTQTFTDMGCPIYSGGTDQHIELLLIKAHKAVLRWIQDAALVGESYKNLQVESAFEDLPEHTMAWGDDAEREPTAALEAKDADCGDSSGSDRDDETERRAKTDENRINVRLDDLSINK